MPQAKNRSGFRKHKRTRDKNKIIVDSPNKDEWVKKLTEREQERIQQVLEDTDSGTLLEAQDRSLERLRADLNRRCTTRTLLSPQERVIKKEPQNPKTVKCVQNALQKIASLTSSTNLQGRISTPSES